MLCSKAWKSSFWNKQKWFNCCHVAAQTGDAKICQEREDISASLSALKVCSSSKGLKKGRIIHAQVAANGEALNIYLANSLINMYAKCGSILEAREVFDGISYHTVVSWNALILGYVENGDGLTALSLFSRMQAEGCAPDGLTFVAALKACSVTTLADSKSSSRPVSLHMGKSIHALAAETGYVSDLAVANSLMDMYGKWGSMLDARRVFDRMPEHTVVSWTTLMLGYVDNGEADIALELFSGMQGGGCAPNSRTVVAALKACASLAVKEQGTQLNGKAIKLKSLKQGMAVHSQADGCLWDIFVANTLVDMYSKCGSILDAYKVFDRMPSHSLVSWNALMMGCVETKDEELVMELWERMTVEGCSPNFVTFVAGLKACAGLAAKEDGKEIEGKTYKLAALEKGMDIHSQAAKAHCHTDILVENTLVGMYSACGSLLDAHRMFDRMERHSVVSWNALIAGYAENGEPELALELFASMNQGQDARTYAAALKACGSLGALEYGKAIQKEIYKSCIETNLILSHALVDVFCKCGSIVEAQVVFDSLAKRDLVAWNTLLAGYSRQGDTRQVFYDFQTMQDEGLQADGITFVAILSACSRAGLIEEGKHYFEFMASNCRITPAVEHFVCMVDILGRANELDVAVHLLKSMHFKANVVAWKSVLSACRKWKNLKVGRLAFESMLRLDTKQDSAYLLMASIYGMAGLWEEQANIEIMRRTSGAWRRTGKSWWTDESGKLHSFVSGDGKHYQSDQIRSKLKDLTKKMKEQGYKVEVGGVKHNICDEQKADAVLCGHSEKLAIACALLNTAPGSTIRIIKNLRVCDDCHKATAFISWMEKRRIVCRDATRFHVFKDGKCSCGDYW